MTGIFTSKATPEKRKCARCGKLFAPKKEGDKYGEKCAVKMPKQTALDDHKVVTGSVVRKGKVTIEPIYVESEHGEVTAAQDVP